MDDNHFLWADGTYKDSTHQETQVTLLRLSFTNDAQSSIFRKLCASCPFKHPPQQVTT